jgi:uncharacterized ParB-like nuclease family protein
MPAAQSLMPKRDCIPIDQIYVPVKRKRRIDPNTVREIAESMLEIGQQAPILVRQDGDRFVLVEGLHRLEACKALGEETIDAFLVTALAGQHETSTPSQADTDLDAVRRKTERLRLFRLAKEAQEAKEADERAAAPVAPQVKNGHGLPPRERPSGSSRSSMGSKPATLSEWLARQDRDGFRS